MKHVHPSRRAFLRVTATGAVKRRLSKRGATPRSALCQSELPRSNGHEGGMSGPDNEAESYRQPKASRLWSRAARNESGARKRRQRTFPIVMSAALRRRARHQALRAPKPNRAMFAGSLSVVGRPRRDQR